MKYRQYPESSPRLFGYDPERDVPKEHVARLVDQVVEETVKPERGGERGRGQPGYDPRLCIKVLVYGYATGVRSSRQLERQCRESLPYLYLTRGDAPSYRTLCRVRKEQRELIEAVWVGLFAIADEVGLKRMGRVVVDSTKMKANASPESVVKQKEYEAVQAELEKILKEAEGVDRREDEEGYEGETQVENPVKVDQMREILRRVRKELKRAKRQAEARTQKGVGDEVEASLAPASEEAKERGKVTQQMRERVQEAIEAIKAAKADGEKHVCVTDPDAKMMGEGREKNINASHSLETAVDNGLIVGGGRSPHGPDNDRLETLVQAAETHEPNGVVAVDGDSGYSSGDAIGRLKEQGLDTCIPTSNTACDLHRGLPIGTTQTRFQGQVPFTYDEQADVYRCPEGNELKPTQKRAHHGQQVMVYRAKNSCQGCPLADQCLTKATTKHRTLKIGAYHDVLVADQQRFTDPEHRRRYRQRGHAVETIFGFLRGTLGYMRWLLRGEHGVSCEASLFKTAYQLRKVHVAWAKA